MAGILTTEITRENLIREVDFRRVEATAKLDSGRRSEMGQYMTPGPIAEFMAALLSHRPETLRILDAGAGIGSLSTACVAAACGWPTKPQRIEVTAYELDAGLAGYFEATMQDCAAVCEQHGIAFAVDLKQADFIESAVSALSETNLFSTATRAFNCAILNPPYRKLNTDSRTRLLLREVGIETSNLYAAFLWLSAKLLSADGELVSITPRSFCNGSYFKPFREDFLRLMSIRRVHVFESRNTAFRDDDVLQENVILGAVKSTERGPVEISASATADDHPTTRTIPYAQLVRPDDPDAFIHIVPDELSHQIGLQMRSFAHSLGDLDLSVSTGRVVDFRATELLRDEPGPDTVPLIYPGHFKDGFIEWPRSNFKKPNALSIQPRRDELLVPPGCYVLVKRFSSKEERRRIVAAIYDSERVAQGPVGFENHLNYFHRSGEGLPLPLARGLTAFLNSTLVDDYFRQFNGHTQVNATDLRSLKFPSEHDLISLGEQFGETFPDQPQLDEIVSTQLQTMDSEAQSDPVKAKKRISEALEILKLIGVPREQQNSRSALTLLSLVDVKAETPWKDATAPLRGITEMMDYFRENYGVTYAPNTRETVRRQTVHQFMQMGLIIANPDEPSRPVNSPKTRYVIETKALALVRTFGTSDWSNQLAAYAKDADSLKALTAKQRTMALLPVTLPTGETVNLTGGGQNVLIKEIVEKFCPRYTPGGSLIYLGDAGQKLQGDEMAYLRNLGITLDTHGKMPDVIVHMTAKGWLVLIEAVTSHGPVDIKRHNELKHLFRDSTAGLVFVTAFASRKAAFKYLSQIAWETEVWCADEPDHLIHFNGERFLGPYAS